MPEPGHVIIAGITTRAMASSAARAGYRVTAIDAFGDVDLRAVAEVVTLRSSGHRYLPERAAAAAQAINADSAAYTSNFENYPAAVSRLARGRELLGNAASVLKHVRNPIELSRSIRSHGFPAPVTRATPPDPGVDCRAWLLKPRRSGGGHGLSLWRPGALVPRSSYLQEQIRGIPGSIAFAADGRHAVVLGLSRQLVGDSRLGASRFRYCGSLLGGAARLFPKQDELFSRAAVLADHVTSQFELLGLNGLDFIARNGVPYPIELNPRYSASMELIERGQGLSMFDAHVQACRGVLPAGAPPVAEVEGKAIVFARRDVNIAESGVWTDAERFADVPHPGEQIRRGHPICTIFARARTASACYQLLLRRAAAVHRATEARKSRAA
jgi:predicted ATP-grasp superfamily ATP-dependent carboligase